MLWETHYPQSHDYHLPHFRCLWNSCISGSRTNQLYLCLLIIDDVDPLSHSTIRVSEPSETGEKFGLSYDGIDAFVL